MFQVSIALPLGLPVDDQYKNRELAKMHKLYKRKKTRGSSVIRQIRHFQHYS